MKTISLLHPFSAQAIGLNEEDLYTSHSKPHEIALRSLQKEGYTIYIDYFTGKWFPYQKIINTIEKRFWPITYPLFRKRHFWRKQKSRFHFNFTKKTPPDLTIINMSGHGSSYVFAQATLLKSMQKPYIAMIGGLHMSLTGDALTYYQEATHIIVHTQIQKKELEKNNEFKKLDIRVMPLGVDIEKFKPNESRKKGVIKLLFVGRISRLKQIELGIEAIAELTKKSNEKPQLIIIGPTSDKEYKKELKKLVKAYKVEKNVQFKGEIAHKELIPYFQEADVLLLPSAHESFGMVMVEAMACGTPVIALQGAGGPDEIIVHGKSGFLCKKDTYSNSVNRLVNDKALLSEFSSNAREYVVQKWSLQKTISCFNDSVKSVLG